MRSAILFTFPTIHADAFDFFISQVVTTLPTCRVVPLNGDITFLRKMRIFCSVGITQDKIILFLHKPFRHREGKCIGALFLSLGQLRGPAALPSRKEPTRSF
jgi:hypothetical protein